MVRQAHHEDPSLSVARASADHLSAPALRQLLRIHQSARCFWQASLDALENPSLIWKLSGDEFETRLQRRTAGFEFAVAAFDLIALRYEERFGVVEQRMETELL